MAVKRNVNTEPDDAFSAVFGDIDQSPLMRQSGEETEAAAKESQTLDDKEDVAQILDNAQDLEGFGDLEPEEPEDQDLEGFEDQEPEESGDQGLEEAEAADAPQEETASMEVTEQDGGQTIVPPGDIKGEDAGKLMAVFLESLEKDLAHRRLDLEKVGDVDTSGLSVLIYFAQALKTQGQSLEIVNVNQDLLNLFSAGRLDKNFAVSFS